MTKLMNTSKKLKVGYCVDFRKPIQRGRLYFGAAVMRKQTLQIMFYPNYTYGFTEII